MGNKIRINKSVFIFLALGILICAVCMGRACMTVRAQEQTFIIDAKMLPSAGSAYEIRLKVENQGQDWEGTVRLKMTESYYGVNDCAYDTELSLPQDSTKQFVVSVPKDSLDHTDGMVQVTLLDKNAEKVAQKDFERLLQTEVDALTMGILSDEYMSLSYLDMGGNEFYYISKSYPIKLKKLDPDNLSDSLNALNFLVIDSYNTDVLADQALENIMQWVNDGGMIIIGTGEKAGETLDGFGDLEMQCHNVYEPGAGTHAFSDYVDVSQLHMAELADVSDKYTEGYDIFGQICSQGEGTVVILPYSLAEVAKTNAAGDNEQQKSFVESMLYLVVNNANSPYGFGQSTHNYDNMYCLRWISKHLGDGGNRLRFGGLKLIVILYVVFVGPILYMILRFVKKRDFYWIAVPVTTLVGIFLVYFAGRGFEVVSTNVYSVTIANLSDMENARTFLRCYDAGHKEWSLRLTEGYEYVGPLEDSDYRSSDENYYYHIRKEGDGLFFGMNPSMGFEDGYFQAGITREPEEGSIYSDVQMNGQQGIGGKVINDTKWDFKYFAVSIGEDLFIYKNLPAGAEVKLEEAEVVYNNDGGYYDGVRGYCYNFLWGVQSSEMAEDADILTALGMGISSSYSIGGDLNVTVIVGVTEDWDKAVNDNCNEVSYGCLYAVQ